MSKKVLIIGGGHSSERAISIKTSNAVTKAAFLAGYESYFIDTAFPKDIYIIKSDAFIYENNDNIDNLSLAKTITLLESIKAINPYKVFIGLHGGEGENGEIQALLNLSGMDFVGSDTKSSAVGMDKIISKLLILSEGIPTAKWQKITSKEASIGGLENLIDKNFGYPFVIKANSQGSSVGIDIIQNREQLVKVVQMISSLNDDFFIEQFIKGREFSIPVLHGKAYPAIELIPNEGFYDYEHKYTDGATTHICPAKLTEKENETMRDYAVKAFNLIGCKDYARVDFILENGIFYFLEINTLPGMTELSLVPESAKASGINFPELIKFLIEGEKI